MKQFFFFGDSVTLGVNDITTGGWVSRFAGKAAKKGLQVPPDTFYNLGVRRNSSRLISARWESEFKVRSMEGTASYFLFCFGTVDMAAPKGTPNVPLGESAAHARDILKKARGYGQVLLLSAPPVKDEAHNQRLEALCTAFASVCSSEDIPFVDIFHPLQEKGYVSDLGDGIHPGATGNEMIAELLLENETIRKWLEEKIS